MWGVLETNPVSEYVIPVLPVLDTRTDQVEPVSVDLSLSVGAVQERLICEDDMAVAVNPVGGCGAVAVLTVL